MACEPVGVLAFEGDEVVGWSAVAYARANGAPASSRWPTRRRCSPTTRGCSCGWTSDR